MVTLSQVVTTVPDLGEGTEEYKLSLMARFSTTYVREQLQNLAQNGSIKLFNSMRGTSQTTSIEQQLRVPFPARPGS